MDSGFGLEQTTLLENDIFANGFRCATNDYCHRRKLSPQRICRHSRLIQFSDRLIVPLCVRPLWTFVSVRYNAIERLCACCPKRPPANRIMGRIIYKEIYNLTKAKVKKYIIAIEIVFYCVRGWRRRRPLNLLATVLRRFWRWRERSRTEKMTHCYNNGS